MRGLVELGAVHNVIVCTGVKIVGLRVVPD